MTYRQNLFRSFILPFILAVIMGIILKIIYIFLNNTFLGASNTFVLAIKVVVCIAIAIAIYISLLLGCGLLSNRDSEYFPFIGRFLKRNAE